MNNQHTFKISQYPIREWLDSSDTTAAVQPFWRTKVYVNGKFRPSWGPFNREMAAAQAVNRLAAYFNQRDMEWSHCSNWWISLRTSISASTPSTATSSTTAGMRLSRTGKAYNASSIST